MPDNDIRLRIQRILRGERRHDDFDRIFLHLRSRHCGRQSIQEIGDFIAHRDIREKGPVTHAARDILTSFRHWLLTTNGIHVSIADAFKVVEANFRIATDEQLQNALGLRRAVTNSVVKQAMKKAVNGKAFTERERKTLNYLGGTFIWNVAFSDMTLFEDLIYALRYHLYLIEEEVADFIKSRDFLTLHVVATLHGTSLLLENNEIARLTAAYASDTRLLGVKAMLTVNDLKKPISASIFLFHTNLVADDYCTPSLLKETSWTERSLDVGIEGKLTALE